MVDAKTNEEKRVFYETCSAILDVEHVYSVPVVRRNRWNNRRLGNGRYPGFGLVQCFGTTIRVVSRQGTKIFYDYDQVYDYLRKCKDRENNS